MLLTLPKHKSITITCLKTIEMFTIKRIKVYTVTPLLFQGEGLGGR
jgi:hypothetical protein